MIVVAGAAGKTGRKIASTLLAQGQRVRVLVRRAAAGEELRARGAEVAVVALEDRKGLERALAGARALYALIPEDPTLAALPAQRKVIVQALAAAVEACSVPHVVLLSATAAVLAEHNGPAAELHQAERALAQASSCLTVLRACYFQENVLGALTPALRGGVYPCFFSSPDHAIPMIACADVARFAAQMLLHRPARSEVVDLLGPLYSARQAAHTLSAALGVAPLQVVALSADQQLRALTDAGFAPSFAAAVAELHACLASGQAEPRGDRRVVGTTPLERTLAAALVEHGMPLTAHA